ncbi:Multifunctional ADE2, partial [Paramuricea clavata]
PLVIGEKFNESKTKFVFDLPKSPNADHVPLRSKDKISAGDGARIHEIEGKSAISNDTTCTIFELLNACGVRTHFISKHDDTSFIAVKCDMIPLEVVSRRPVTGTLLKRNPGVKEGYRFSPPKMETFFKDDANHDPQWSHEQIIEAELKFGGVTVGEREIELMTSTAIVVFEILEKAWATVDCTLVDKKVEFGVNARTGEILLADVVDNTLAIW